MPSVASTLAEALRQQAPGPLCVGYSGGLDSTVLLHALATSPQLRDRGLRAWHVHHGLHEHADRWAGHCAAFCASLPVPLTLSRVAVSRGAGQGLEAAARHARHAAFVEGLADDEVLVFAHHRDDQAETFLLRALRASGPDGLGAMRTWRRFGRGQLWRPLLGLPRASLETYATEHGLHWIEDPSNADASFDRNFLRQHVLPLLRERWPHAGDSLARSAGLCRETAELLDADDDRALVDVVANHAGTAGKAGEAEETGDSVDPGRATDAGVGPGKRSSTLLSRSRLSELTPPRRARVLRRWIDALSLPPLPAEGITQIESVLLTARADASATFQWHGAMIHAWRDLLHAGWVQPTLPEGWQVSWNGVAPLALPGGGTLSLRSFVEAASAANQAPPTDGFGRSLIVHARRGGERITLPGRGHSHALRQVLQDLAVPPWERARLPLLSTEGELLAAGDRVYSAEFDRWLREHHSCLHWQLTATDAPVD